MPNVIDANGLQTKTLNEVQSDITTDFQTIYGPDIDVEQNSPDGQSINIFSQSVIDVLETLTQTYNSFDPDKAFGVVLDARVAYNGIARKGGTFTVTPVTVVITQSVTLQGLDNFPDNPYTVADNNGNNFQLEVTQSPSTPGSYSYAFRAQNPGQLVTIPNTIIVPVTIVVGVDSVNNPSTYTQLGVNEETDAALKIRRQKSVSIASQGYLAGLLALLENLTGVTGAFVYENVNDMTDGDGVPGHSIWVIVGGTATDVDIATAIYQKRNAGCGMFGAQSYVITQVDGTPFTILWDAVEEQDLFIKFTASSLDGINAPNYTLIKDTLPTLFLPGVFAQVDINELSTFVQEIDSNTLVTLAGFSLSAGGSYTNTLTPTTKKNQFVVSSNKVIILPILLSPSSATVPSGGSTQQFTPLGGYGPFTWSMQSGAGSVNSSGLYTSAAPGTDVVKVMDSLGNQATATVTVSV